MPPTTFLLHLLFFFLLPLTTLSWRPWPHTNLSTTSPFTTSKKYEGSSDLVHLQYHMGPVLSSAITIHPIWYGNWARPQKRILRAFLRSISSRRPASASVSRWWGTVRLYADQTGRNVSGEVRVGKEKCDRLYSHGKRLSRLDVQRVIRTAVASRTRPLPVDATTGLYLVLTSDDVMVQDFCGQVCGFHYFTFPSIVGDVLPYAWVGNSARFCPGTCAYPFATPPAAPATWSPAKAPNGDVGVDGMISVVAHELAELASNPLVNAWYAGEDPSFPTEIADLCEGIYGTGGGGAYTGQVTVDGGDGSSYNLVGEGGRRFLVQWVWNPIVNYCSGPNALDQ